MKKGIFLSFLGGILLLLSGSLFSQTFDQDSTQDKDLKFEKGRKISGGQGVMSLKSRAVEFRKEDFLLNLSRSQKSKSIYFKLNEPVSKAVMKKLKDQGIKIKSFVSDSTYIAEVNTEKLDALKNTNFIHGFAEIDIADKMSERVYKKKFGDYAKDGNYVKVVVSFYEDVIYDDAVSLVRSVGGIVESEKFSRTNKLVISIHPDGLTELSELGIVKYIDEIPPPPKTDNIDAGKLSEVFWDNEGNTISGLFDQDFRVNPPVPYVLKGAGINVAVKDGGVIYSHSDFTGRLDIVDEDSVQLHPTHVAGTIGAELSINDNDGNTGGMAEFVHLYSYSYNVDGNNPPVEETEYTVDYVNAVTMHSAFIINNSWGHDIDQEHKDVLGDYTIWAEDIDDFIYDYYDNDALLTKSAGNNRELFYADCEGYCTMDDLACTKNTVVVGSVGNTEADNEISDFSSCGPADDGRIKPDVVADGFELTSTIYVNSGGQNVDAYNNIVNCGHTYEWQHISTCKKYWKGTSMSCPVVTGICALIHEAYMDMYEEYPTADIVKALLCNFAKDLGKKGPDFAYGFGLVNAKKCIDAIEDIDAGGHIVTGIIEESGDYMEFQFTVGSGETDNETVTLAWIDPAANPAATNAIVNDLDISVSGTGFYSPFYYKEYNDAPGIDVPEPTVDPTTSAKIGSNRYDTVEQVLMEPDNTTGEIPAGNYTMTVSGFSVPIFDQRFAVVSSLVFNRFQFNNLKIKDRDGNWVSNPKNVYINNPDLRLMFSDLGDGFNPANLTIQYQYSSDGGTNWSAWINVNGIYANKECTQSCYNPHKGVAYAKVLQVNFIGATYGSNKIKFKLTYSGQTNYSREYIVMPYNYYFVAPSGNDTTNTGSKLNPWKTISHALDTVNRSADLPAIIQVQRGTYSENIILRNHAHLYGGYDTSWATRELKNETNMTVIQGTGTTHVVAGANSSTLDGFVIKGGKDTKGGGIYLDETSPTITNCIIKTNTAENASGDAKGGGIYAFVSYSLIKDCIIDINTAKATQGYCYAMGGGVYLESSYVKFENCIIQSNRAEVTAPSNPGQSYGGGIYAVFDDSSIKNTLIKSNTATSPNAGFGGGIFINGADEVDSSTTKILGCRLYSNSGQGGIFCNYSNDVIITNCTLYGNGIVGMQLNGECAYVTNTIIWNNTYDLYGTLSSSKITYCCIEDGNFDGINGNINDNPQFKSAGTGDFRIKNDSPCIDAGNDGAPGLALLERDFQNQERIFEFDNSGTQSVDIGADEYVFGFASPNGFAMDNDGVNLTWESLSGKVYYIEYTEDDLGDSPTWTQVQLDNEGIVGLNETTSWKDDGSEITPSYDDQSVIKRFYRVFFKN